MIFSRENFEQRSSEQTQKKMLFESFDLDLIFFALNLADDDRKLIFPLKEFGK